jgi:vacuolar protein sorting-associated protein 45
MDGVAAIRSYIDRIVTGDGKCKGMKVMLLDASTTQIVSSVYSQTEILSKEIYLVARLDDQSNPKLLKGGDDATTSKGGKSSHLKAVVFCRPTEVNIGLLVRELARPRFAEYHIFLSGILTSALLRLLAESDAMERVRQVQEFYGDFLAMNEDLLTLQCRHTLAMTMAAGTSWAANHVHLYDRNLQGLQSMLLALKRQPSAIRFARHSPSAEQLAKDIHDNIASDQIFHFHKRSNLLLLILDRRDDPITPLLSQWTYQAMVHEMLGLNNHRVILKGAPNVTKDLEEVVLSANQDAFFRENRHKNFGQLGEAIQKLLQDYQSQQHLHSTNDLNTIEEMQSFMERFPELRSQSHNVSKHVAIMGELARLVDVCSLMDVSQFEQELACADNDHHSNHLRELLDKLSSNVIKIPDKLRLGLLYALRYETLGNLHRVRSAMTKGGVPPDMLDLMDSMLRYGGSQQRAPGLFETDNQNLMSKMTRSLMTSVQGVSNVYSQHVPLLMTTLQNGIAKGKLKPEQYPFVPGSVSNNRSGVSPDTIVPDEVIIFMVGGVTYEEATKVSEFNDMPGQTMRVILGGSTVHNSTSFLEELKAL